MTIHDRFQAWKDRPAEDAAQAALMKLPDALARISDADHFKNLAARIAFQVALNALEKRRARAKHEARTPARIAPTLTQDEVVSLHRAIARLEDDLRTLIVERSFEGRPLDDLAAERGCSAPAVCKRLDKAREALRLVPGAGLAPSLDASLEAMAAVPCPRDLVRTPPVIRAVRVSLAAGER